MIRTHVNLHRRAKGLPAFAETVKGRVAGYHESLAVTGAVVKVSAWKLAEARRRGCRQVCLWVDGERTDVPADLTGWARFSFNPNTDDTAQADGRPFTHADAVAMTPAGVFVLNPRTE